MTSTILTVENFPVLQTLDIQNYEKYYGWIRHPHYDFIIQFILIKSFFSDRKLCVETFTGKGMGTTFQQYLKEYSLHTK